MSLKKIMNEETRERLSVMVGAISEKEDKNGYPYLMVDLLDGESTITARVFRVDKENCGFNTGNVIDVTIISSRYNGSMGYIINNYEVVPEGEYNVADYIISAPMGFSEMWSEVFSYIDKISIVSLKELVTNIYQENMDKYMYWSAARSMHHNYYGGLLYHSLCVTRNAYALAQNYNEANTDLVIAGALLHDVGKLLEFDTDNLGVAEYTVDGNLFGHLFMGAEMVKRKAAKCLLEPEIQRQLLHIIVSHHDNPEWGAIKKPSTIEARIVSSSDLVDSQVEMMKQANKNTPAGEMSENFVDGVKIYHPYN